MIDTVDIAGLRVHAPTKEKLLTEIEARIKAKQQTSVITPYSEFLYAALREQELMVTFNQATFSIPDGVGVLWASRFLSIPLTARGYYAKVIQAFWQMVYSGAAILLKPKFIYRHFPEKIVGADLFWDLMAMAERNEFSVYILGGQGDVPERGATLLRQRYPKIKISGFSNKFWNDPTVVEEINQSSPDMVLVFYPARNQERWIFGHLSELKTYFIIGLGGTLDYAVGEKLMPPRFLRVIGLEWLYRLITQPTRLRRIWNGVMGLIVALIRYKVFSTLPYRDNVVIVVTNKENKVLVCQRNPNGYAYGSGRKSDATFNDYWQFPQGGIDKGEDIIAGARREAVEEVGLENLEYLKTQEDVNSYTWNNARRVLLFNPLKYRGQKQSLVYFKHNGSNEEVKLDTYNNEFVSFRWVEASQLVDVLHEERRNLADIVSKNV